MEVFQSYSGKQRAAPKPSVLNNQLAALPQRIRCSPRLKAAGYLRNGLAARPESFHPKPMHCLPGTGSLATVRYSLFAAGSAPLPNKRFKSFASLTGTAFRGPLT